MIEVPHINGVGDMNLRSHIFPTKSYAIYVTLFFLSLIGLSISYTMTLTSFSFNSAYQGIELLSYLALFFSLTKLIKVNFEYSYFRMVGLIYLIWQFLILFRGDFSDVDYMGVKQLVFDLNYGGMVYFIPLLLFINFNFYIVKRLFDTVLILSLMYAVGVVLNSSVLFNGDLQNLISLGTAETYFKYLAIPTGILALNFNLLSSKTKILVVSVFLMILIVAIFRARRGMIFMTGTIAFFAGLNFFISSDRKFSIIFYFIYGLLGLFVLVFFTKGEDIKNISLFNNISERGMEDTRSYVEDCFYSDMTTNDWIFGKGYNGGYKCPGIDDSIFKDGIRKVIETDYLQLIMNGGFINVFLLFVIMIPAIVLGLFYSNNNLIKTLAIWIFLWLIFLYPANVYSLNVYHVSIWLSAGLCYSQPLRNLPNSFVVKYFLSEFTYNPILNKKENA